uniref:Uncharacterized protein n=1 Tax=Kwoniella pini CBS 10737 TaxID=1296096 RepID=A0A1B9I2B6_9TREE|nr:uncharacterized protein I206_04113 [Kwoniella pini CBS 10737]OCF49591.1 hypothetical protein I206_04113 [Kwoniella pini CBS 10737]
MSNQQPIKLQIQVVDFIDGKFVPKSTGSTSTSTGTTGTNSESTSNAGGSNTSNGGTGNK